ncbi:MAG: hypothetical protein ACF8LL_07245 [Phycisphaerales bacterium]
MTGTSSPESILDRVDRIDARIARWMSRHGITLLRFSLGIVFCWFGVLKFFPGVSPAEELATRTITVLSGGAVVPAVSLPILAAWETAIGLGLITERALRLTLLLLFLQMPGTISPLFVFPELTFRELPFVPTIEGQYIIKNLVLLSAGFGVVGTVRGGRPAGSGPVHSGAASSEPNL